ncbi:MAG: TonB-dependent receptor [Bacteroides sp.]|nr:TonB-dependent receptor [Bacteroides sp.]
MNVQLKNKRTFTQGLFLAVFLLCSTLAFAQSRVSGTVTDKSGEPLIGVNVLEKGTTNGCITDIDGKYSLNVARGKTLVFSFIGYTTQEVKVNQNTLNVTLAEDAKLLDEVVVVGYGSMTRKDVTSSITTVKADDLNKGVYTDPGQMLQGKVPGLTITQNSDPNGGVASIQLRGASSLRSNAMSPYYVIDGVPGMDLALVAPEDIESIDVLRDATATAIYGSKAANGVIIVTTKKGNTDKATVSYNGYVAFDNVIKELDFMSASELRSFAKANNISIANDAGASTNWQDEAMRTAISHNHNVSINGGNDKTKYSASITYMDRQGIIKSTDMNRINGRAFIETKTLKDRLTLSFNLNASVSEHNSVDTGTDGAGVFDAMHYYSPLVPVTNEDGSWYEDLSISQNYNPMSLINEDRHNTERKMISGTFKATLDIIDGLKWNMLYTKENKQWMWNNYNSQQSQINQQNGLATRSTSQDKREVFETYLNYNKSWNEDTHKLGLMVGYSWEENNTGDGYGLATYNFYNDDLSWHNLAMGNKMDFTSVSAGGLSTLRMISFYGRANYSYKSKYMLQATVRRDGSSAFGKNNRWGTFPSVSAAWRMSEEGFIKDLDIFHDLKLRVGYGVSGNSFGFDAFTATQTYNATGWFTYTDANGNSSDYRTIGIARNANPDLKWESTSMFNIGVDFAFFGGRLSGSIEYYDKQTDDLIYDYGVSTSRYPVGWLTANVGNISNKGIEFTINAIPVQTKDWKWETSLTLSHNKNVVEKLSNAEFSKEYIDLANPNIGGYSTNNVQRIMEGEPIGTFYMWEWAGYNDAGQSIFNDYDAEGNLVGTTVSPEDEDRRNVGSAQPKLTYGWNNTINYKNWSLTAFFQGVAGNKIFNATRAHYNNIGNISSGKNVLSEVVTQQKISDTNAQAPSDRYLENGSYLRLAQLTLGYNFGNIGDWVSNVRLYATCNNLFTLTGYEGRDPEISLGGLEPGMDWRNSMYPRTRSFLIGLSVNF